MDRTHLLGGILALGAAIGCASNDGAKSFVDDPERYEDVDEGSVSEPMHAARLLRRRRAERGLEISPVPIDHRTTSRRARIALGLGSYIVNGTAVCGGCHSSPAGFLAGGNPFPIGPEGQVVYARNLTPDAATGMRHSRAEFVRAMRTGKDLHHDPTKMLVVMPWPYYRWMSDEDLEAVYAYLRAIPPVHNAVPLADKHGLELPDEVPFPGVYDEGQVERELPREDRSFDPRRGLAIDPLSRSRGRDVHVRRAYGLGSYIAGSMTACNECHTHPDRDAELRIHTDAWLTGGTVFAVPPPLSPVLRQVRTMSSNLKGEEHGYFNEKGDGFARFREMVRTQSRADETPAAPLGFPMNEVAANLDKILESDLRAVYTYMKLTPDTKGPSDVERQDYARYCESASDCRAGESCAAATHECEGQPCRADVDCDACQTCEAGRCAAPLASSTCLLEAQ